MKTTIFAEFASSEIKLEEITPFCKKNLAPQNIFYKPCIFTRFELNMKSLLDPVFKCKFLTNSAK